MLIGEGPKQVKRKRPYLDPSDTFQPLRAIDRGRQWWILVSLPATRPPLLWALILLLGPRTLMPFSLAYPFLSRIKPGFSDILSTIILDPELLLTTPPGYKDSKGPSESKKGKMTFHVILELSTIALLSKPFQLTIQIRYGLNRSLHIPSSAANRVHCNILLALPGWLKGLQSEWPLESSGTNTSQGCGQAPGVQDIAIHQIWDSKRTFLRLYLRKSHQNTALRKSFCLRKLKFYSSFLKIIAVWMESPALYKAQTGLLFYSPHHMGTWRSHNNDKQAEQW